MQALIKLKMPPERMMKLREYWGKMSKHCSGPLYDLAGRLSKKNCLCGKKCWPLNVVLGQCQDGHIIIYGNEHELKIVSFGEFRFLYEGEDEQEEKD